MHKLLHILVFAILYVFLFVRINLESTYTTMAMFVVEVPCGYTAASIVCLAMAIQEDAISNDSLDLECSNRIHAAVMSIMSLVCWTHNAEVSPAN